MRGILKNLILFGNGGYIPSQTLTDITGNRTMDWSGGVPLGNWALVGGTVGGDPGYTEVAPGGGAGTGAVKFTSTAVNNNPQMKLTSVIGTYYDLVLTVSQRTSGQARLVDYNNGLGAQISAVGTARAIQRLTSTGLGIFGSTTPISFVVDYAEVNVMTLNPQLTAPSADMRITQFYTLPATPVNGSQIWVMPRISNFSSGNYWLVLLTYTGTQWNITTYTVSTHTRTTTAAAATNIGATNGLRLNMNGNLVDLQTTADNGANWTSRGTQVNDATYNTATVYNTLWSGDVMPGVLRYEPAA